MFGVATKAVCAREIRGRPNDEFFGIDALGVATCHHNAKEVNSSVQRFKERNHVFCEYPRGLAVSYSRLYERWERN